MFAFRFGTPIKMATIVILAATPPGAVGYKQVPTAVLKVSVLCWNAHNVVDDVDMGQGTRGRVKCSFPEDHDKEWYNEFANAKSEFGPRDPRRVSRPQTGIREQTEATVGWQHQLKIDLATALRKPVVKNHKVEVYCS